MHWHCMGQSPQHGDVTEPPPTPPTPPGWPDQVAPPGSLGWEKTAVAWLWQYLPPHYQPHRLLLDTHPLLLARQAYLQVTGETQQLRAGYRTARQELRELGLEPHVVEQAVTLYAQEGARLKEAERQITMVTDALRGVRWRPRKGPDTGGGPGRRRGGMG